MSRLDLGVLISGRGSNLQSFIDAIAQGRLDAQIKLVLSNRAKAEGLARAKEANIPTAVLNHRKFDKREDFDAAMVQKLQDAGVKWVALAGFMRIVTPVFLRAFPQRVINIHPALAPAFPGVDAQGQAIEHGVRVTGCTIHLVDEGVDTGAILVQAVVPVRPDDTRESLAARLLPWEHEAYVQALQWLAEGRLEIEPPTAERTRPVVRPHDVWPLLGLPAEACERTP